MFSEQSDGCFKVCHLGCTKIVTWSRLLASNNAQSQPEKDAKPGEEKDSHIPVIRDLCADESQSLETAGAQQKPKGNVLNKGDYYFYQKILSSSWAARQVN